MLARIAAMSARFWSGMRVTTPGRRTVECGRGMRGTVRRLDGLDMAVVVVVDWGEEEEDGIVYEDI
jgi:hypothetical protein